MRIWVFAEEVEGSPTSLSLELLTKARSMTDDVSAFLVGSGDPTTLTALGAHGATKVFHLDPGDSLASGGTAAAMAELAGSEQPDLIMFGLLPTDRDVAGRLAARLGLPLLSNAVDITASDGNVTVVNEINGGAALVESTFAGSGPRLVVARPKSFTAEEGEATQPEVAVVSMPDIGHAGGGTVVESHTEASEGPRLDDAEVIVAGGRGMGSEEQFHLANDLAELLSAAVGATRAVVDAGWAAFSLQIGQTGKTVKPGVYIALGVSGAMQHLVGMKDSGTIIAINKDEEAPIFAVSDLGIVGDVHKVVPKLIDALQAR